MHAQVFACMWSETSGGIPQVPFTFVWETVSLSSESQGSTGLHLPSMEIQAPTITTFFMRALGN